MTIKTMKKGAWELEELGKLFVVIAVVIILALFAYAARDKIVATLHNTFLGNFG